MSSSLSQFILPYSETRGGKSFVPKDIVREGDFEDVLHLYLTFEERFNTERLETYVNELGVEDYYAELTGV